MGNLNDILKLVQTHRDLNRLAYGGDWVAKIFALQNTYGRYERHNDITSVTEQLMKRQRIYDKYVVPSLASDHLRLSNHKLFDSITRIGEQNRKMEAGLSGIVKMFRYQPQIDAVFRSKQFIDFYIGKTLQPAVLNDSEQEIEVIETVQEASVEVISAIQERGSITKADLQRFVEDVVVPINHQIELLKADKKNEKKVRQWELLKNTLISLVITITFWLVPSPTTTNGLKADDIRKIKQETLKEFSDLLNQSKIYKRLNVNFRLRELPVFSSSRLMLLKKGLRIEVLNSSSSWAFVIATDADGYPVNGWVPKKFLSK